jgi:hypothetical protein
MDTNLYALEKHVDSKLRDARAFGARAALVSSLRVGHRVRFAVLATVVRTWLGRRGLRRVSAGASGA